MQQNMSLLIDEHPALELLFARETLYWLEKNPQVQEAIKEPQITNVSKKEEEKKPAQKLPLKFSGSGKNGIAFLFLADIMPFTQVTEKLDDICKAYGRTLADAAVVDLSANKGIDIMQALEDNDQRFIIGWGIEEGVFATMDKYKVQKTGKLSVMKIDLFKIAMADNALKKKMATALKSMLSE